MIVVEGSINNPFFIKLKKNYYKFHLEPLNQSTNSSDDYYVNVENVIQVGDINEVELSLFSLLLAVNNIDLSEFKLTSKYYFYNLINPNDEFFKVLQSRHGSTIIFFKFKNRVIPLWSEYNYKLVGSDDYQPPLLSEYSFRVLNHRVMFLSSSEHAFNYYNSRFGGYSNSFTESLVGIGRKSWFSKIGDVMVYNVFNDDLKYLLQVVFTRVNVGEVKQFNSVNVIDSDVTGIISFSPLLLSLSNGCVYKISEFDLLNLVKVRKSVKVNVFGSHYSRDFRFLKYVKRGLIVHSLNPEFGESIFKF